MFSHLLPRGQKQLIIQTYFKLTPYPFFTKIYNVLLLLFISVSSLVNTPKLIIPIILASLSLQVSYVTLVIHFPSYPEILVILLLFICSGYRIPDVLFSTTFSLYPLFMQVKSLFSRFYVLLKRILFDAFDFLSSTSLLLSIFWCFLLASALFR